VLDQSLLNAAVSDGAALRQPCRVEHAAPANGGVRLRIRALQDNTVEEQTFDQVLLADGRSGLLGEKPKPTGTIGIKTHYRHVQAAEDAVTLYATAGSYGGVAPIERGTWNIAFAVPASLVKSHGGDIASLFAVLRRSNTTLDADLSAAEQCGSWLASPLPRYAVRDDWPRCMIPIGNAAAAIEPIGGEGMGLALRSAELAVEAIMHSRLEDLPSEYRALWRRRSITCRWAGAAMSSTVGEAGAAMLSASSAVARAALWAIGK
jgi:flavin-dependent dehydrogenase